MMNSFYHVTFPKLGINININPVALSIGNVSIRWYGIFLALGFLLAYIYIFFRAKDFKLDRGNLTDIIIVGTITGIICARIYYISFYPGDFYKINPYEIFNIREGGIAIYGGIIGGILGGGIAAKIKKVRILPVLDITSLGLLIGQAIGRWGNFFNQEAFGSETDFLWGMASEATKNNTVHPCFLYESLWCILGFVILHILSVNKRLNDGQYFAFYLLWYGVGRIFIESLRTDSLMLMNWKVSELVSLILIFVAILLGFFKDFLRN